MKAPGKLWMFARLFAHCCLSCLSSYPAVFLSITGDAPLTNGGQTVDTFVNWCEFFIHETSASKDRPYFSCLMVTPADGKKRCCWSQFSYLCCVFLATPAPGFSLTTLVLIRLSNRSQSTEGSMLGGGGTLC